MIDYSKPTPETDAFMAKIDGDEIDLEIVRAKLHDMERQRDSYRETLYKLEKCLQDALALSKITG